MIREGIPVRDTKEAYQAVNRKTLKLLKESKNNINLQFLRQDEYDIRHHTKQTANQYLCILKGGRYCLIPSGCDGKKVPDYLGVKFAALEYWSPLPSKQSSLHPSHIKTNKPRLIRGTADIYECE